MCISSLITSSVFSVRHREQKVLRIKQDQKPQQKQALGPRSRAGIFAPELDSSPYLLRLPRSGIAWCEQSLEENDDGF